jgi:hypothetical protein
MKRTTLLLSIILALVAAMPLRAQDKQEKPKGDAAQAEPTRPPRTVSWYRVDLTVNEFEDAKKMNARHYTLHINDSGDRSNTKFGTRVPVPMGSGSTNSFNYIDVGLNISLRIAGERGEHNVLEMGFELSSFAIPEQAKQTAPGVPILRQVQTSNSMPLTISKPVVVASLDDPNSTKRYQFEVTLTKL